MELKADAEREAMGRALNTLEHFMQAGVRGDSTQAAELLDSYEINSRRAQYDAHRLFNKEKAIFSQYVSLSSDIYGYEVRKGLMGKTVELEGGIETDSGLPAEFKARVVFRKNRWKIAEFEIN